MDAPGWRRWISPRRSDRDRAARTPTGDPLDAALRYLAARPRSEAEVRARLARAGHAPAAIDDALDRLRQVGYVDDAAFAAYWVDQRQTFRPRGARLIRAELRQHGVIAPLAHTATADLSTSALDDALRAVARRAERELAADSAVDWPRVDSRLSAFLARRGFEWNTIAAALRHLHAQHADATDQLSTSSDSAEAPTA